jgi:hypothetical protein
MIKRGHLMGLEDLPEDEEYFTNNAEEMSDEK